MVSIVANSSQYRGPFCTGAELCPECRRLGLEDRGSSSLQGHRGSGCIRWLSMPLLDAVKEVLSMLLLEAVTRESAQHAAKEMERVTRADPRTEQSDE